MKAFLETAKTEYEDADLHVLRTAGGDPHFIFKTLAGKEVERLPCGGKTPEELASELATRGICPRSGCVEPPRKASLPPPTPPPSPPAVITTGPASSAPNEGHQEL